MNKIAHALLQSCFQVAKEIYVFKEHSRIRIATIYIHHISTHMHILIWLYDSTLFGSKVWLYNICICKYALSCFFHSYELHIRLSCRKRKGITSLLPWWGSTNTTFWEIWECHTMESLSFIVKTCKNSGIMVEQRTWDIVLDLIVLLTQKCGNVINTQ